MATRPKGPQPAAFQDRALAHREAAPTAPSDRPSPVRPSGPRPERTGSVRPAPTPPRCGGQHRAGLGWQRLEGGRRWRDSGYQQSRPRRPTRRQAPELARAHGPRQRRVAARRSGTKARFRKAMFEFFVMLPSVPKIERLPECPLIGEHQVDAPAISLPRLFLLDEEIGNWALRCLTRLWCYPRDIARRLSIMRNENASEKFRHVFICRIYLKCSWLCNANKIEIM